jgi:hypothetical protein
MSRFSAIRSAPSRRAIPIARPHELIDELLPVSDEFRTFWARHDVRLPASATTSSTPNSGRST